MAFHDDSTSDHRGKAPATFCTAEQIAKFYRPGAIPNSRGYYEAPCPSHHGKKNKLNVKDVPGGGLKAVCWSGGCSYNDILNAFARDGFRLKRAWPYPRHPESGKAKTTYRVDSPTGDTTKPRRKKVRQTPGSILGYALLLRNDSSDALLVLTEGESDGDAMLSLGLPDIASVSLLSGAKCVHLADFSAVEGRRVAVWGDNSPDGAKFRDDAVRRARKAGAASVMVVPMVGQPGSGWGAADLSPEMIKVCLKNLQEPPKAEASPPEEPRMDINADWIVARRPHRLAGVGGTFAVCDKNGLWTLYYDRDRTTKAPLGALLRSEAAAADLDGPKITAGFYSELAEGIHVAIHEGRLQNFDPDLMFAAPIIPFEDGSHTHCDVERCNTCRCDISKFAVLNFGWRIPPPKFDLCDQLPAITEQFPEAFFKATARLLCGPEKVQDMLKCSTSDAGKTSMIRALALALPGACGSVDATTYLDPRRSRFTPAAAAFAKHRIVLFDEAGRLDAALTAHLFNQSGPTITIEKKGVDLRQVPRIGTGVYVGHVYPAVDTNGQGVRQRVGFLWNLDHLGPISRETALLWESKVEIERLRAWMIRWAKESWEHRNEKSWLTPERDELLGYLVPPPVLLLHQKYKAHDGSWVPTNQLAALLGDAGLPVPEGKGWSTLIRQAFPKAHPRQSGEARDRGWVGLGIQ